MLAFQENKIYLSFNYSCVTLPGGFQAHIIMRRESGWLRIKSITWAN